VQVEYRTKLHENDWGVLATLYAEAGMGEKSEERLNRVFSNSQFQSFLYIEDKLVGVARAFSDGGDCAVVCDVSISPVYQGKGLGRSLMKHLMSLIPPHERIMLFCTAGLETYYEEFGFGKMTTGMCIFKNQANAIKTGYIVPA